MFTPQKRLRNKNYLVIKIYRSYKSSYKLIAQYNYIVIDTGVPWPGGPEGAMAPPVIETRRKIGNMSELILSSGLLASTSSQRKFYLLTMLTIYECI